MKIVIDVLLVLAAVSLIVGVISRALVVPVPVCAGLESRAFLGFSLACLAFAATLGIRELARK